MPQNFINWILEIGPSSGLTKSQRPELKPMKSWLKPQEPSPRIGWPYEVSIYFGSLLIIGLNSLGENTNLTRIQDSYLTSSRFHKIQNIIKFLNPIQKLEKYIPYISAENRKSCRRDFRPLLQEKKQSSSSFSIKFSLQLFLSSH